MFLSLRYALALILSFTLSSISLAGPLTFDGAEHMDLGNQVNIKFENADPPQTKYQFHFANGLTLTYGELIAFGDYYGIVNAPISKGTTVTERKMRFLNAFNALAINEEAANEAKQILAVLHEEKKIVDEAIAHGEDPEQASKALAMENTKQLNCITGGGCGETWFLQPGRYLQLAREDYDHFGHNAWASYQVGHELALEYALTARKNNDKKLLELAYAINAFACHFLSDRFAAGHLRTPRVKLPQSVTPELTGTLLAGFMHIEENAYGLHVSNQRGDHWIVYGDHGYYALKNKDNREMLKLVLQTSADQIYNAYQTGIVQPEKIDTLLPYPDETKSQAKVDISPLFYFDEDSQQLLRRSDITNPYDRNWTADWWGWSSLILLSNYYGIPPEAQAILASSSIAQQAAHDGLIKDQNLLQYLKTQRN